MKRTIYLLSMAACALSAGCLPTPGTSPRTPEISGRVLDATTRKPVAGAIVALHEAPQLRSAITDSDGRFSLNESRNFHLFAFIGHGGTIDMLSSLGDDIDISHPAYRSHRIDPWRHAARRNESRHHDFVEAKDILLRPKP